MINVWGGGNRLETYLKEIDSDSPCVFFLIYYYYYYYFDMVGAILFYVDDVVLFSKSGSCLQRFLNKLFEFCTFILTLMLSYLSPKS